MSQAESRAPRYVAYYRVSTAKQGQSGLGLEAQQAAVRAYLNSQGAALAEAFTEIESGKRADRPQLAAALDACRRTGAVLVIAKLDRLSRDAHFLMGLEKAGVAFVAADMPAANQLTIRLMAVIAQEEREMISRRTREALAAAKARGTKLGGYRPEAPPLDPAQGRAARSRKADAYARDLGPLVLAIWQQSISYGEVATELTRRGIKTPQDGRWTRAAVRNLLKRYGALQQQVAA